MSQRCVHDRAEYREVADPGGLAVLSANFRWARVWQARPEEGGYQAVDDWNAGLGVFIRL